MSWSIHNPQLTNGCPASEAKRIIEDDQYLPDCPKSYILAGIDGIVAYFAGEAPSAEPLDPKVRVTGHGHLCIGVGSHNVTTATIEVKPAE